MFNHQNPSLALPIMNQLLSQMSDWTESSYGNDICASIAADEFQIFLPNSENDDENLEEVSYFQFFNIESGEFTELPSVESVLAFAASI